MEHAADREKSIRRLRKSSRDSKELVKSKMTVCVCGFCNCGTHRDSERVKLIRVFIYLLMIVFVLSNCS